MRILLDARMYGLENSGIGRYVMNLITHLQNLDEENEYSVLLRRKYFNSLNFKKNWTKILADYNHYTVTEQFALPFKIRTQKPDLVHFPHLNISYFYGGKFIVTIHDLTMHRQSSKATTLPLPLYYAKRIPFKIISRKAAKTAQKIIVPSQAVKEDVTRYYDLKKDKVDVIYEGLSESFSDVVTQSGSLEILSGYGLVEKNYFFYVGNAYPHKNLGIVIEALSQLNKNQKEKALFVIAGSRNVFTKRLERIIRKNKASEFVKLVGYVHDRELPVLYNNSVAFVYPSLSEGFGLQGLEAMSSGTLLLASDIPVFREVYQNHAIYFDPHDPGSVKNVLETSLEIDHSKRRAMIENAREFLKKYSWKKMAQDTLDLYNKYSSL